MYSFQKTNSIFTGKQVLGAAAANIDGFLSRETCVSSTQLNRVFGRNKDYLYLENHKLQDVFLSKTKSSLTGKQCVR
jgi:hypothetical protein